MRMLCVASVVAIAGCGSDDVMSTAAPTVEVPAFANAPFFVPVGESITFTANLGTTDGSALGEYDFRWNESWQIDPKEVLVELGHPSPGVETITLTPQQPNRFELSAYVLANEQHAFTNYAPVIAWGGTPVDVKPFAQQVDLVVGERRPVAGYPGAHELSQPTVQTIGKDPVVLVSGNPAIAIIVDNQVQGVAVGATTLDLTSGGKTATIPLIVHPGVVTEPPVGGAAVDGLALDAVRPRNGAFLTPSGESSDGHLALDSKTYPAAVLRGVAQIAPPDFSFSHGTVLLARWTGSGIGSEWVSDPWDDALDARMTVSNDIPYVAYFSKTLRDIVIASRPAAGGPASWEHRRLPMDLDLAKAAGLYSEQYTTPSDTDRPALMPRDGGGVWLAYRTIDYFGNQESEIFHVAHLDTPGMCAEVIKLAEVTPTEVTVQEVLVRWYGTASDPAGSCPAPVLDGMPIQLLPPPAGEHTPRVLSTAVGDAELFELRAGQWTLTDLGHSVITQQGFNGPTFVAVARSENAADPVVLLSYDERSSAPLPSGLSWNALPGKSPLTNLAYSGMTDARLDNYFGFQAQGRLYTGSAFAGPLIMQTAYDGVFREEPTGAWETGPYDRDWGDDYGLVGKATRGRRLHVLSTSSIGTMLFYTRDIPLADPTPTDVDTSGTRLGSGDYTPLASNAPSIASDASRYVLTDPRVNAFGTLLRSAGPGQPFTLQATRTPGSPLASAREISTVGTDVLCVRAMPTALEVYRSTDLGQTFTMTTSTALIKPPLHASTVTPSGALFAMLFDPMQMSYTFQIAFAGSPTSPITLTTGLTGADVGTLIITSGVLLPSATGAVLVVQALLNDGTAMHPRMLVRRYDNAGAIVAQLVVDPLLPLGQVQTARGCSLATGAVLCANQQGSRRIDLATGVVTVAALPAKNQQELPPAPITLSDGRFLLPVVLAESVHTFRAGYRLSADGVNWGAFVALRPTGGDGQAVYGVAPEANAKALFVLGDSGLMMAGDGQTTAQGVVQSAVIP